MINNITQSSARNLPLARYAAKSSAEKPSGNYIENLRKIMSKQKTVVDYILEKYNDPSRRQDEDLKYIETAQRLIDFQELYIGLMEDLFG